MVPLCYRNWTENGLKNPACILYAPFGDVQDANEMRTVEDATQSAFRHTPSRFKNGKAITGDRFLEF